MSDEEEIQELIKNWMDASKIHDTDLLLDMMTEDAVFMVSGSKPFGKREFEAASKNQKNMKIDGTAQVQEIQVCGSWAFLRSHLTIEVAPNNAKAISKSGYALTILRKENGKWRIARDANLILP